jgi:N-acetyl-1-D-myo-inositol-2-amino-2-deoxy-alpha-D-glucopyranoside deacetylase
VTVRSDLLAGRTILAVFAHPDDESLACGGTLARAADAGARVVLLCLSRGEHGTSGPAGLADPATSDLGHLRARELQEAARVLGIADVRQLDYPDGNLRWMADARQRHDIAIAIREYQPDVVITFDDDGLYWHPDHIGVHEHTLAAVTSLGHDAPHLYYVTMPPGGMDQLIATVLGESTPSPRGTVWGIAAGAFGASARTATLVVDVHAWVDRKLMALRCHRTQVGDGHPLARAALADVQRWLGREHFRRAPIESSRPEVLERLGEAAGDAEEAGRRAR